MAARTGQFVLTFRASGEQQNGYVRAANEQERPHGAEKQIERGAQRSGVELDDAVKIDAKLFREVRGGLPGEFFDKWLQFGLRLLQGDPWTQLDRSAEMDVGILRHFQRDVDVRFTPLESRGHDANDFVGFMHQLNLPADDVGISEVIALPELIGDHDNRLSLLAERRV